MTIVSCIHAVCEWKLRRSLVICARLISSCLFCTIVCVTQCPSDISGVPVKMPPRQRKVVSVTGGGRDLCAQIDSIDSTLPPWFNQHWAFTLRSFRLSWATAALENRRWQFNLLKANLWRLTIRPLRAVSAAIGNVCVRECNRSLTRELFSYHTHILSPTCSCTPTYDVSLFTQRSTSEFASTVKSTTCVSWTPQAKTSECCLRNLKVHYFKNSSVDFCWVC